MRVIEIDMKHTRIITLRIPKSINDLIEIIVKKRGYPSKSDFIRSAIIEFLTSFEEKHTVSKSGSNAWNIDGEGSNDAELFNNPNLVIIY